MNPSICPKCSFRVPVSENGPRPSICPGCKEPLGRTASRQPARPSGAPGVAPWLGVGALAVVVVVLLILVLKGDDKPNTPKAKPGPENADNSKQPPTLESLANDVNAEAVDTRKKALQELRARGPQARPALAAMLSALKDADPEVRKLAEEALAVIGPGSDADLPSYSAALRDPSPEVRVHVAGRLAEMGLQARGEREYLQILALDENPHLPKNR